MYRLIVEFGGNGNWVMVKKLKQLNNSLKLKLINSDAMYLLRNYLTDLARDIELVYIPQTLWSLADQVSSLKESHFYYVTPQ